MNPPSTIADYESLGFNEGYEIVRTLELVLSPDVYRIEILKAPTGAFSPVLGGHLLYSARYYEQTSDEHPRTWIPLSCAWVATCTEEDAVHEAMVWLSGLAKGRATP